MTQKTTGWYEKVVFCITSDNLQTYKIKKKSASIKNYSPAIMQSFKEKLGSERVWVEDRCTQSAERCFVYMVSLL